MQNKINNKLTTGNSKDEVSHGLCEKKHIVIKRFSSNISRALKNIEKQKNFREIIYKDVKIKSVSIDGEKNEDGVYSVTMPYVEGIVGEDYAKFGTSRLSNRLKIGLDAILMSEMAESVRLNVKSEIFKNKLENILDKINDTEHKRLISAIYKEIKDKYFIPVGVCHGDLTLSNIIYSDGELNLIDFLSGYIESPLQDVVKIMQDFKYGWSFRYMSDAEKLKAYIFTSSAMPESLSLWCEVFREEISIINKISVSRIAPYVMDEKTNQWLTNTLRRVCFE